MKKYSVRKEIILALVGLFLLSACEEGFETKEAVQSPSQTQPSNEIDKDPETPTPVSKQCTGLEEPLNVLFIGNSYTSSNNLRQEFEDLACGAGINVAATEFSKGGYYFELHDNDSELPPIIQEKQWDYVVLQNQSNMGGFPISWHEFYSTPYLHSLVQKISDASPNAEIVFFMTWGRRDGDSQFCPSFSNVCTFSGHADAIETTYNYYQGQVGGVVAPVGLGFKDIYENPELGLSHGDLYDPDGSHPSEMGTFLAASFIFARMFEESPENSSYIGNISEVEATTIKSLASQYTDY